MKTQFERIVDISNIGKRSAVDLNDIAVLASCELTIPAQRDEKKRMLLIIDDQNCFIEGGELQVKGSVKDIERLSRFIYNNIYGITTIMASLDTHIRKQIFFPCWWVNSEGKNPDPYTIITYKDVVDKQWYPVGGDFYKSLQYLKGLENAGNDRLCIWPYHAIKGTPGHNIENELAKMLYFFDFVRDSKIQLVHKGEDPYSEMYGIIKPEFSETPFMNMPVLQAIEEHDEIYIAGEAKDYCFKKSVMQILEIYADHPEVTNHITLLMDCTSAIAPDNTETDELFESFKKKYGIKIAKSTDVLL